MDVAARAATDDDLDVVADLAQIAVDELRPRRGGQVWYRSTARHAPARSSIQDDLADPDTALAVGTIDGTACVGYGVLRIEEMRDGSHIGMLTDLFTLEGARGVGVGEAVMNLLIDVAGDNGCTGVDSLALPGDRHTKNFFESFGLVAQRSSCTVLSKVTPHRKAMTAQPELCVGGIAIDNDNLLLIRRGHGPAAGTWSIPGGRVDPGELLAEAVVRELAEETGLEVVCGAVVGVVERFEDDRHFVIIDYRVTVLDPAREATAGDDAAEVAWVPLSDVADWNLIDGLAEFLHDHGILATIV